MNRAIYADSPCDYIGAGAIENYFGFGIIHGEKLVVRGLEQIKKSGASFLEKKVTRIEKSKRFFRITLGNTVSHTATYLILAFGTLKTPTKELIKIDTKNNLLITIWKIKQT